MASTKTDTAGFSLEMIGLFNKVQLSAACTKKAIVDLKRIYRKVEDGDLFFEMFKNIVNNVLVIFKREASVERCVDFIVRFVAASTVGSDDSFDTGLLDPFLEHLLSHHDAKEKAVRFRACQMVSKLLHELPDEAELEDDQYESIESSGMKRLQDKIPAVRMQASIMLTRLQDPTDASDPITNEYLRLLKTDSSPDVRKTVLMQITPTKKSIPLVLEITRDKSQLVRKQAYRYIRDNVDVSALKVTDRLKLLQEGLKDRIPEVKKECVSMLCSAWLNSKYDTTFEATVVLLKQLDVVTAPDTCASAASEIIDFVRDWKVTAVDFESLDCESAFFWRLLVEKYHKTNQHESLETITPGVSMFAKTIAAWGETCADSSDSDVQLQAVFVTEQLLILARYLDYADEVGRSNTASAIKELLLITRLPDTIVKESTELLKVICPDEQDRVQRIVEAISDIREPMQQRATSESKVAERARQVEKSNVIIRLTELKIKLEALVQAQEFVEAGHVKEEINELEAQKKTLEAPVVTEAVDSSKKTDPDTMFTCLTIVKNLFLTTKLTMRSPELSGLVNNLVLPGIKSAEPVLRRLALTCLGMAFMLCENPSLAKQHLPMLMMILSLDQDIIKKTILHILFDIVLAYGVRPFAFDASLSSNTQAEEEEETEETMEAEDAEIKTKTPATTIISLLQPFMHDEDEQLRTIAVEGFARLMLLNHVTCPSMFGQLALLFFNPMTEDDQQLRQCLSVFFPAYAFSASAHGAIIEAAFLPTLRKVMHAPKSSPLHGVKDIAVARFFLYYTSQQEGAKPSEEEESIHNMLSIKVLNEMISNPKGQECKVLASVLNVINLENMTSLAIQNLFVLTEMLVTSVSNRGLEKKINDFKLRLAELNTDAEITDEQREALERATEEHKQNRAAEIKEMGATSDGEQEEVASKRTTRTRAARHSPVVDSSDGSDFDEEDFLSNMTPTPTKTMTKTKTKTPKAAKCESINVPDENDGGEADVANNNDAAVESASEEEEEEDEVDEDEDEDEDEDNDDEEEEEVFEVEALLDDRKKSGRIQYLVKWKGYGGSDNSWEPASNISKTIVTAYKKSKKDTQSKTTAPASAKKAATSRPRKPAKKDIEDDIDDLLDESDHAPQKSVNQRSSRRKALSEMNEELDDLLI